MSEVYVGRFAPTPSGPLHFGSLVAAVASFVDAKAHHGKWLLRIEDIDPPRCRPDASDEILTTLENFGLYWDDEVLFQSLQTDNYLHALQLLKNKSLVYECTCSRSQLQGHDVYPQFCRHQPIDVSLPSAVRIKVPHVDLGFDDLFLPSYSENIATQVGDFILQRKEKIVAYQLAVVVDDATQRVTHVVRGADLYDQTPRQQFLQQCLDLPELMYGHVPIICNGLGQKLSKQNLAPAISAQQASTLLQAALQRLGHEIPRQLVAAPCTELLQWAGQHWQRNKVPGYAQDPIPYEDAL